VSLVYQVEPLRLVWDDIIRLSRLHWQETEAAQVEPLNPDKERYLHYNDIGYHRQYTARNEQAKIVGHAGVYISESMHTGVKIANEDTWFMQKEYRKGWNAIRLLRFVEKDLKALGVKEGYITAKLTNIDAGRLMELRGYKHYANEYMKVY
jgi:hypothetical protein